jgi:endonuclease III
MKTSSDARTILEKLRGQHPNADTELDYHTPFELLVATILSAQTTDVRVNSVTPALFARFPTARALADANVTELETLVQPTGFFRMKARSLIGMANALVDLHGGEVPPSMDALVALPGVGRKTANVVLGHALGVPGLPVDRHVLRVSNRIGLASSDDPEAVEDQLTAILPEASWTLASDTLILHGRRICKPRPLCDRCAVRGHCAYFRQALGATATAAPAAKPKPRAQNAAAPAPARRAAKGAKKSSSSSAKALLHRPVRKPRRGSK